jgi:hypothetical protein
MTSAAPVQRAIRSGFRSIHAVPDRAGRVIAGVAGPEQFAAQARLEFLDHGFLKGCFCAFGRGRLQLYSHCVSPLLLLKDCDLREPTGGCTAGEGGMWKRGWQTFVGSSARQHERQRRRECHQQP